jgi:hypothetical protein
MPSPRDLRNNFLIPDSQNLTHIIHFFKTPPGEHMRDRSNWVYLQISPFWVSWNRRVLSIWLRLRAEWPRISIRIFRLLTPHWIPSSGIRSVYENSDFAFPFSLMCSILLRPQELPVGLLGVARSVLTKVLDLLDRMVHGPASTETWQGNQHWILFEFSMSYFLSLSLPANTLCEGEFQYGCSMPSV